MTAALIIATIFVVLVLTVGVILTIKAANSMNENYDTDKSFSSVLWAYVISIPIIIIVVVVAILIFYQ